MTMQAKGYTVKQLSQMAGVSPRTLRYYDQIGLLKPEAYGANGYRFYGEESLLRLQQILFFKELDFSLEEIRTLMDRSDFDLIQALHAHRQALEGRIERLNRLIETVDNTILHLRGEKIMSNQDFYQGFDEARQQQLSEEAEERWGETVAQSQQRWSRLSRAEKNDFLAQMHAISTNIAANMDKGPQSAEVQEWIDRWYRFINDECYDCSLEVFENLGHMYVDDPRFKETYEKIRPGMAAFMDQAMTYYVAQKRVER